MKFKTVFFAALLVIEIAVLDFAAGRFLIYLESHHNAAIKKMQEAEHAIRTSSTIYHHDLKPLKSARVLWGNLRYTLTTNSLGFRDSQMRDIPLETSQHRIVFIGDSFTEGIGVDFDKTFVGIIQKKLAETGTSVLNAGVLSYSPVLYLKKIDYLINKVGLEFDELVVYIDVSDMDDENQYHIFYSTRDSVNLEEERKKAVATAELHDKKALILTVGRKRNSLILRVIALLRDHFKRRSHQKVFGARGLWRSSWTFDEKLYQTYGREGLERAKAHMDDLSKLLKSRGIQLTVAVYPWPDQILHRDLNSRQVIFWKEWAQKNNVHFINHFPDFINGKNSKEVIKKFYLRKDMHWNQTGHRLVAEHFLKDRGN